MSVLLERTDNLLEVEPNGLYKWQNEALDVIDNKDAVIVVPPGAGKSLVAYNWANVSDNTNRIIITCPTKAKVNDYVLELQNQGLNVGINTGDAKYNTDANIIVCTQELYNLQYANIPNQKVIIDEFHYALNDETRRNSYMYGIQSTNPQSSLLIMSATLSDSKYIADELSQITGRNFVNYTSNVRATNLEIHDEPLDFENELPNVKNAIIFTYSEKNVNDISYDIAYGDERFVSDNKMKIIDDLATELNINLDSIEKDSLARGVGQYYGKMEPVKKLFVTELYKQGIIDTVVATDALSVGINLPAENVIFATDKYSGLTDGDIIQQASRAGRKGFYETGHVFVTNRFMETDNQVSYITNNDIDDKIDEINEQINNITLELQNDFEKIRDEILNKYDVNNKKQALSQYNLYYNDDHSYQRLYALVRDSVVLSNEDKEYYLTQVDIYSNKPSELIKQHDDLINNIKNLERDRRQLIYDKDVTSNEHYKNIAARILNPVIEKENLSPVDLEKIEFDGSVKKEDSIKTIVQLRDSIPHDYLFTNDLYEQMINSGITPNEASDEIIEQFIKEQYDPSTYFKYIVNSDEYWETHEDHIENNFDIESNENVNDEYDQQFDDYNEYDDYDGYDDYNDYDENNHWIDDFDLNSTAEQINYLTEVKYIFAEYNRNNPDSQIDLTELNNQINQLDYSIAHFNDVVKTIDTYFNNINNEENIDSAPKESLAFTGIFNKSGLTSIYINQDATYTEKHDDEIWRNGPVTSKFIEKISETEAIISMYHDHEDFKDPKSYRDAMTEAAKLYEQQIRGFIDTKALEQYDHSKFMVEYNNGLTRAAEFFDINNYDSAMEFYDKLPAESYAELSVVDENYEFEEYDINIVDEDPDATDDFEDVDIE